MEKLLRFPPKEEKTTDRKRRKTSTNHIDYEVTASVYKKMLFFVISDEVKKEKNINNPHQNTGHIKPKPDIKMTQNDWMQAHYPGSVRDKQSVITIEMFFGFFF